jgi:hypothetical protein
VLRSDDPWGVRGLHLPVQRGEPPHRVRATDRSAWARSAVLRR